MPVDQTRHDAAPGQPDLTKILRSVNGRHPAGGAYVGDPIAFECHRPVLERHIQRAVDHSPINRRANVLLVTHSHSPTAGSTGNRDRAAARNFSGYSIAIECEQRPSNVTSACGSSLARVRESNGGKTMSSRPCSMLTRQRTAANSAAVTTA